MSSQDYEDQSEEETVGPPDDCLLLPGEGEKKQMLAMFQEMRKESFFCDVAFLCHGILFRAHRVVVSSWSRWLRALLCESPDEEVVSVDLFDPASFGAILDYMYGVPLKVTVETADSLIKIIRRLEMHKLEQQCWRYLMTIIDANTNCELLHELADRYDCPPLKLAAWRILQETVPGYAQSPASKLFKGQNKKKDGVPVFTTGLTGPGEEYFSKDISLQPRIRRKTAANRQSAYANDDELDTDNLPSVFHEPEDLSENESDDEEDEQLGEEEGSRTALSKYLRGHRLPPEQLPPSASAKQVIGAWAARLKEVYESCLPENGNDYTDPQNFYISNRNPTVKLVKPVMPNQQQQHHRGNGKHVHIVDSPSVASDTKQGAAGSPDKKVARPAVFNKQASVSALANRPNKAFLDRSKQLGMGRTIDWREELKRFYLAVNMPEKIAGIPTVMEIWAGKEVEMINTMISKYKQQIPSHMLLHLDQLMMILETQTESSFVQQLPKKQ